MSDLPICPTCHQIDLPSLLRQSDVSGPMLLSIKGAAAYLGVGETTMRQMIRRGDLPHLTIGSDYRVSRKALDAWVTEQEVRRCPSDPQPIPHKRGRGRPPTALRRENV